MANSVVRKITCGILFNHSFKLLDNWGAIADCVLYNNKYFSPEYFPSIGSQYTSCGVLSNSLIGHSFQLTTSNLIYTHVVEKDFESELPFFEERISKFLVPKIIEGNGLITRRIGVVFACEVSDYGIQEFASKYFKPEFTSVTDFRFSKKESTIAGANFSNKSDFINKIYTVGSIGEKLTGISFDYQHHFIPPHADISTDVIPVIKKGKAQLETEILSLGERNGKK